MNSSKLRIDIVYTQCYYHIKEVIYMLQSVVNVRFDEDLKKQLDSICSELGITVSSAITLFAKKVVREKRIPFALSLDSDGPAADAGTDSAFREIQALKAALEELRQRLDAHSPKEQHKAMKLQTAQLFKDYMVIQQEKPFVIWGNGEPGCEVTVSIQGKTGRTTVLRDGTWKAVLPPLEMSRDELLCVATKTESLTFQKVAVGEVWLAGGQSNMEFYMRYDADRDAVMADCENADIRFFDVPEISYPEQADDFDYSRFGFWRTCHKDNLEYFSAVAYYFARKVQAQLDVPVGIIGCNYGGTPSCAWMSEDTVTAAGPVWLEEYRTATKDLDIEKYKSDFRSNAMNDRSDPFSDPFNEMMLQPTTREFQLSLMSQMSEGVQPQTGPCDPWRPCGLFETMLMPLTGYGIRGFLWYQGESDSAHADLYEAMLTALINQWRGLWREELPFLFVQLAPLEVWLECSGADFPVLRQAQENVAASVPNTWMASIGDVGMRYDIHPKKKQPVGTRLALLALGHVYGREVVCDAPSAVDIQRWAPSNAPDSPAGVAVTFDHAATLTCTGDRINALQVFADGRQIHDYEAQVSGPQLIVTGTALAQAENIRIAFARTDYYEVNIYNEGGLPVLPFELECA